jgi:hypothetical protein
MQKDSQSKAHNALEVRRKWYSISSQTMLVEYIEQINPGKTINKGRV